MLVLSIKDLPPLAFSHLHGFACKKRTRWTFEIYVKIVIQNVHLGHQGVLREEAGGGGIFLIKQ